MLSDANKPRRCLSDVCRLLLINPDVVCMTLLSVVARYTGQLHAAVQYDAVHVLQPQQPLHRRIAQRLQLLAVDP